MIRSSRVYQIPLTATEKYQNLAYRSTIESISKNREVFGSVIFLACLRSMSMGMSLVLVK